MVMSWLVPLATSLSVGVSVVLVHRLLPTRAGWGHWMSKGHQRLSSFNRRVIPTRVYAIFQRQLSRAAEPRGYQPEDILSLQEAGATVGLGLGLLSFWLLKVSWLWTLPLAIAGAAYPWFWLAEKAESRRREIARAMPFHLDLLTLAVEAGLDFAGALAKVVERGMSGAFREELQLVLKQLKLGRTREQALRAMMVRVDLPPLSLFVIALLQADRMGTGLGKVLRTQSTQLRVERALRAEKLASQAPVKMLLPLVVCIFPTVFLVLFGPLVFAFLFGHVAE